MLRTALGVGAGFFVGATSGVGVEQLLKEYQDWQFTLVFAALMAVGGAITGAIVGGVADVLAFWRHALMELRLTGGPHDDYRDTKPRPAT